MTHTLSTLISHLSTLAHQRLAPFFLEKPEKNKKTLNPEVRDDGSQLSRFLRENPLNADEYGILAISIITHVQPHFFDGLMRQYMPGGGDFPQIGGTRGANFRGFLPTGETALFLLAGEDPKRRFEVQQVFAPDHLFSRKKILWLEDVTPGEPAMSGRVVLAPEYVDLFVADKIVPPRFSTQFPAERVETNLEWSDLVLSPQNLEQVQELLVWLRHGQTLLNDYGLGKRIKPGFRALFWGPPGTGKTLTAGLLGKHSGRDVYKIDLSMVVSKFIGETEKNLANLFDRAENKDWILFFDEADALFGKRTSVRDAHDKYANQEVSYLLQRVESYGGLVILASNFKSNIDEAFIRRFQSIVHFPMPRPAERLRLWQQSFPEKLMPNDSTDLSDLAQKYELSGAAILNIVQFACLRALERGQESILEADLKEGISREFGKEGKIV